MSTEAARTFLENSHKWGVPIDSHEFAQKMDEEDCLANMRNEFIFPPAPENSGRDSTLYLCGNSLGLQPKGLKGQIEVQLQKWASQGVEGHFEQPTPWLTIDDIVQDSVARLVGALPSEVVVMNTLTSNLHILMSAFYKPTPTKFKILTEKKSFPSDRYALYSQIVHHGYDPETALIELAPRDGHTHLLTEDILQAIRDNGDSIAVVMLSGVQYYTGQFFDLPRITKVAHEHKCIAGFDLAHAVGNLPLQLHDWGCDFAVWCSYKYLNCGPGSIGGAFIHERHGDSSEHYMPRLSGWWGHRLEDRFDMGPEFIPCTGAYGFRLSNPAVLLVACVRASLDVFDKAGGMLVLREKSLLLTGYLEHLLKNNLSEHVTIFTPEDPAQRGCQLSLSFTCDLEKVFKHLQDAGVMCDIRKPDVMRIAPTPLYNSFKDVYDFVDLLRKSILKTL